MISKEIMNKLIIGKLYECYYREDIAEEDSSYGRRYMGRVRILHDKSDSRIAHVESPEYWNDYTFTIDKNTLVINFSEYVEFFEFVDANYKEAHKQAFSPTLDAIETQFLCVYCTEKEAVYGYKSDDQSMFEDLYIYFWDGRNNYKPVIHALCVDKICRECENDAFYGDRAFLKCECGDLAYCWFICGEWLCGGCVEDFKYDYMKD